MTLDDNNYHLRQLWERDLTRRDFSSNADIEITFAHSRVHAGYAYRADLTVSDGTTFDTADVLLMAFNTPNSNMWIHMVVFATSTGAATLEIFEDATVTAATPVGNSIIPIYNKNRNSAKISGITDTFSGALGQITGSETAIGNGPPTVSDNGTTIFTTELGATGPKVGGESRDLVEWVLRTNTTYVAKLTSHAENVTAHLALIWYENTTINS